MGKSVTRLVVMVAGGKGWGNRENNKESEETPNTTRQSILRLDSTQDSPPCSKLSGQRWPMLGAGKRRRERKGGPGGNKDVSVSLPGT